MLIRPPLHIVLDNRSKFLFKQIFFNAFPGINQQMQTQEEMPIREEYERTDVAKQTYNEQWAKETTCTNVKWNIQSCKNYSELKAIQLYMQYIRENMASITYWKIMGAQEENKSACFHDFFFAEEKKCTLRIHAANTIYTTPQNWIVLISAQQEASQQFASIEHRLFIEVYFLCSPILCVWGIMK